MFLSAFVSREVGFGRTLTEADLVNINGKSRGVDKTYTDTVVAMELLKTTKKPLLEDLPLVKYLYMGAHSKGFWNSFSLKTLWIVCMSFIQSTSLSFSLITARGTLGNGRAHSVHNKSHDTLEERNQS
jgi:hypothetical protein